MRRNYKQPDYKRKLFLGKRENRRYKLLCLFIEDKEWIAWIHNKYENEGLRSVGPYNHYLGNL
jgi:hypothetical protein